MANSQQQMKRVWRIMNRIGVQRGGVAGTIPCAQFLGMWVAISWLYMFRFNTETNFIYICQETSITSKHKSHRI